MCVHESLLDVGLRGLYDGIRKETTIFVCNRRSYSGTSLARSPRVFSLWVKFDEEVGCR
jgi:hypothetical protein